MNNVRSAFFALMHFLVLVAVASPSISAAVITAAEHIAVSINVEQIRVDRWRITYALPMAVKSAAFARHSTFRKDTWEMISPGLHIEARSDGGEIIVSQNEAPFREIVLEHGIVTRELPKDYWQFFTLTDGSVFLYTGHYDIELTTSLAKGINREAPQIGLTSVTLIPMPDKKVVAGGQVSAGALTLSGLPEGGTYAYFGTVAPTSSPYGVTVLDPGLPAWIADEIATQMPRLYHYYEETLGRPLGYLPTTIVSWGGTEAAGFANKGGTLDRMIQLHVFGKGYAARSPEGEQKLAKFLAHEAAHMWNSQMFAPDDAHPWIHEGGADALAYAALRNLSIVSEEDYQGLIERAAGRCLDVLNALSLPEAKARGRWNAHYECGAVFFAAAGRPVGMGTTWLWRSLFDSLVDSGRASYHRADVIQLLRESSLTPAQADLVAALTSEKKATNPSELVQALLRNGGFPVQADRLARDHRRTMAQRDLRISWRAGLDRGARSLF